MIFTQLSPTATPGTRHSFAAKTAADVSGPHTGLFTELSVLAIPGMRKSFTAKTGDQTGDHTGYFTDLSVMGLPGMRHLFSAKGGIPEPVQPVLPSTSGGGGGGGMLRSYRWPRPKNGSIDIIDGDLLDLLMIFVRIN